MAFSIKTVKKVSATGLRDALIKAVKKANPNLTDLNFEDFTFTRDTEKHSAESVKGKIENGESGYSEGMTVKQVVTMSVKTDPDIRRNYTERSYETTFNVNCPDVMDLIKGCVQVENMSELTWDDYDTVLSELNKINGNFGITDPKSVIVKTEQENENSKYIYLQYDTNNFAGSFDDSLSSLMSYTYKSTDIVNYQYLNILKFHFTREDAENKRDVVISNPNLDVSENGMTENIAQ